jgi:hypothetical protein
MPPKKQQPQPDPETEEMSQSQVIDVFDLPPDGPTVDPPDGPVVVEWKPDQEELEGVLEALKDAKSGATEHGATAVMVILLGREGASQHAYIGDADLPALLAELEVIKLELALDILAERADGFDEGDEPVS